MVLTDVHMYDIAMTHDMTLTHVHMHIKYTESCEMHTYVDEVGKGRRYTSVHLFLLPLRLTRSLVLADRSMVEPFKSYLTWTGSLAGRMFLCTIQ